MTKTKQQSPPSACQIYLVVDGGDAALSKLTAALDAGAIASVLIRPGQMDAAGVKQLVEFCQQRGVASLIENDASLARTVRADGVHLNWSTTLIARLHEAREILGNRPMIGVEIDPEADAARHEAMELAEAGAEYMGFGPGKGQAELLAWWSEIFEVPCVAFGIGSVEAAVEVASLTRTEFVGVHLPAAASPADCSELVGAVASAIGSAKRTGTNA